MKNLLLKQNQVNVRIRIASLWTAVMFCYIYGDFFSLFVPGRIENLINGNSGAGATTPVHLLLFALLMTPAILMIYLTLVLSPRVCRIANISVGLFYSAVMTLVIITSLSTWMMFYIYFGALEIILSMLIVKVSWIELREAISSKV